MFYLLVMDSIYYHKLKTSYLDFLKILKNLIGFKLDLEFYCSAVDTPHDDHGFKDYFDQINKLDKNVLEKMYGLLINNPWAKYYANCNADIQGWIDFENEMNPVFDLIRHIIDGDGSLSEQEWRLVEAQIRVANYKEYALSIL